MEDHLMFARLYHAVDGLIRPAAHRIHDLIGVPFRWFLRTPAGCWIRRNTTPNQWSALRFPMAIFIGLLLSVNLDGWAIPVFVLGILTDRFDGEFARMDRLESAIGETIDTCADATLIAAVMLGLARRWPPLVASWPAFTLGHAILSLEVLRMTGGLILHALVETPLEKHSLRPNMSGKFKTGALTIAVVCVVCRLALCSATLMIIGLWLSVYSLARHLLDYCLARRQRPAASS